MLASFAACHIRLGRLPQATPFHQTRSSVLKFGRETYGCRPYLFTLAPDRQPGATGSLDMLSRHPPEII
jgi:hypothetical protein